MRFVRKPIFQQLRQYGLLILGGAGILLGILAAKQAHNMIGGLFIGSGVWCLLLYLVYSVFKSAGIFEVFAALNTKHVALLLLGVACVNLLAIMIVGRNQTIYYWDFAGPWLTTIEISTQLFEAPLEVCTRLVQSINEDTYNIVIPFVLSFPLRILGPSFLSFTLLILNLFLLPGGLCLAAISHTMRTHFTGKISPLWFSFFFLLTVLVPNLLRPSFMGYFDAFGFLMFSLMILLASTDYFFVFSPGKALLLAITTLLTLLARRTFAYSVAGYVAALIVLFLYEWISKKLSIKAILPFIQNMLISGVAIFSILILFFKEFLFRGLFNTYSVAYSAYQYGSIPGNFLLLFRNLGLVMTLLFAFGFILGTLQSKNRAFTLFLGTIFITASTMLFQVQSMDLHHQYLILPSVILLALQFVSIVSYQRTKAIPIGFGVLFAINLAQSSALFGFPIYHIPGFSNARMAPMIRNDLGTIAAMARDLNTDFEGKPVYVISSSDIFSEEMIMRSGLPYNQTPVPQMYGSNHIDLRDGFPTQIFMAEVVLVAEPIQTQQASGQNVVTVLAQDFLDGKFSNHFRRDRSYYLENGVTVWLYKRTSPFVFDDYLYWADKFNEIYPEYPDLFYDRILEFADMMHAEK